MIRTIALLLASAFSARALADESESEHKWGVGLQGNMPLWGGLSVKYRGLANVHLQLVEHYVQDGDGDVSVMVGLQTPIIVARGNGMSIFIAPAVGFQEERDTWESVHDEAGRASREPVAASDAVARIRREETDRRQGGALFIGTEIYLDGLFGLDTRSRYGLTLQFGQAIGRVTHDRTFDVSTEDADGNPADLSDFPDLEQIVEEQRKVFDGIRLERSETRASLAVGGAFHIYF